MATRAGAAFLYRLELREKSGKWIVFFQAMSVSLLRQLGEREHELTGKDFRVVNNLTENVEATSLDSSLFYKCRVIQWFCFMSIGQTSLYGLSSSVSD